MRNTSLLASLIGLAHWPVLVSTTPLDDYVSAPDPHYKWHDTVS
jgi:hypothetical protein